jgi:hypothetical protein
MKNRRNYYRILQVQPDASPEVIRASYKAIMRELKAHPDLGGNHWNATIMNEAYDTLRDPGRRAAYDRKLFEYYTKQPYDSDKIPTLSYFCPFCKRPLARQPAANDACPSCRSPLASNHLTDPQQGQRTIERLTKSGQVALQTEWPHPAEVGSIVDLSPHGMRFQCPVKLLPNMTIKISCRELNAVAVVRHSHRIIDHETVYYSVGVEFLTVQFKQAKGGFHTSSA